MVEAEDGIREVIVSDLHGEFAGYLTIVWKSSYSPFRDRSIPEITDLNVLIKFQRRGVATHLLDRAEQVIGACSELAGIRVGLTADYGAAQALYVRRGYVPDGFGLFYQDRQLSYGECVTVDDHLTLGFTKQVTN